MPAQSQQQGGSSDNSLDFLWMIVLIVGGLALAWYFGREYIVAFVLKIRFYEASLVQYIINGYIFVANYIHLPIPDTQKLKDIFAILNSKPVNMPLDELVGLSNAVGRYYVIPFFILIVGMGVVTYYLNVSEKFKHIYTMESLRKGENKIWPQVTPVMRVDLVKKDLDEGPWASSLSPMLFAKKHKLLVEKKEDSKVTVSLNEGAAYRVFSLQLGQFYRDIQTFPMHVQALFAIFLARANQDRENADKLLTQIAASATSSDKLDFKGVKEVVIKHKNSKYAKFIESRHAYLLTAMATLLELARTDGVLATAEFIWLKPLDRTLWYTLNSVGRQTAFPEVSGVFAHWLAEKKLDRPLKVPVIEEAVKALNLAIKEMVYEPEEE
jgi:intracellular multiplication protein IcmP